MYVRTPVKVDNSPGAYALSECLILGRFQGLSPFMPAHDFKNLTLAIIDTETTGMSPSFDRVIEIGIIRVEKGEVTETYSSLVDPECTVSPFITNITGITNEDLDGAPLFADIAPKVRDLLDGAVFVAHNARFDYGFLKSEFERAGIPFTARMLCTVKLSRRLYPQHRHHGLEDIIARMDIPFERRHRALDDAGAVWHFLRKSTRLARFSDVVAEILKRPSLPPLLTEDHIGHLPEAPGVYLFYGKGGVILYVGEVQEHQRAGTLALHQ